MKVMKSSNLSHFACLKREGRPERLPWTRRNSCQSVCGVSKPFISWSGVIVVGSSDLAELVVDILVLPAGPEVLSAMSEGGGQTFRKMKMGDFGDWERIGRLEKRTRYLKG